MKRLPGLAALALVAATAVGCATPTSSVAGAPAPVDDRSGASTGAGGPTAAPGPSASTGPSASPSTRASAGTSRPLATPTGTGAARSLVLASSVRAQIVAAWVAGQRMEPGDVAGMQPGSAYYGYMPSTGTYWAVASFVPTPAWERKAKAAPNSRVALQFQDGPWIFSRKEGQGWRYVTDTGGTVCPPAVPAPMLAAWALPTEQC
jgi:hypothetical protein